MVLGALALLALGRQLISPWSHDTLDWEHPGRSAAAEAAHLAGHRSSRPRTVRATACRRCACRWRSAAATLVSVGIGVSWGATAVPRRTDRRRDDAFRRHRLCAAVRVIVIILSTVFPRGSLAALFIAIGAVGWLTMARIVRGQTLSLRNREFVAAAIAGGVRTPAILWRHIFPNVIGAVLAYATLTIPQVILFEVS
jgi:oligopeptide transport system permease protein